MSDLGKITVNVSASGIGTILLDGVDISGKVSGLNVRIRAGELTRVFLVMAADTEIEAAGLVTSSALNGVIETRKELGA